MPKYFLEFTAGTLGVISIAACVGWYNSYMKCLELQNPGVLTAEQIIHLQSNLEDRENQIRQLNMSIMALSQEINNLKGINEDLRNNKILTLQRRLDAICQQVAQIRFVLSNRDETIIRALTMN